MKVLKVILLLFVTNLYSQDILLLKDRAKIIDKILKERIDNILPKIMKKEDVDMWVLIAREYNEDPIIKTFLPSTWLNARRRTILVISNNENNEFETVSSSLSSLLEITRIVLLLAFNQVEGKNVLIIGSSLYSLAIIIHISTSCLFIISGNT